MTADGLGAQWQRLCAQAKTHFPWVCWLCQQPIPRDAKPRTRWSWSLDHIDARSTHGTAVPSLDRVRPAHYGCNSRRGNKAPASAPRSRLW